MDAPAEQLRTIVLPADPVPIIQPRIENFDAAEIGPSPPIGPPGDIDINAVMPLFGTMHYAVPLNPLSVLSVGTDQITVTCSAAHGLVTNAQIVVQGLSNVHACGAYSVTVTTATTFTYQTRTVIPVGALLTGSTRMITANIGLPRGYTQLPAGS